MKVLDHKHYTTCQVNNPSLRRPLTMNLLGCKSNCLAQGAPDTDLGSSADRHKKNRSEPLTRENEESTHSPYNPSRLRIELLRKLMRCDTTAKEQNPKPQ